MRDEVLKQNNTKASQYITFYLNDNVFGVDINYIKEITPNTKIFEVPKSEKHIKGLLNVRGEVILVVDLSMILNNFQSPITKNSHILILRTSNQLHQLNMFQENINPDNSSNQPIGLFIDGIGDVIEVHPDLIEATPANADKNNAKYFSGVAKLKNEILILLDTETLV